MRRSLSIMMIALAAGCGGGDSSATPTTPSGATTVDVFTPGLTFSPFSATVPVGGTVRWNLTGVPHDVTFNTAAGAPANIPLSTGVFSRTFNTRGTFKYDCKAHNGMTGEIVVQ